MRTFRRLIALAACLSFSAPFTTADEKAVNPQISKIVDEVSEDRIKATIEKLVSFGTRNTMSTQDDPDHGVGAARQWIFNEFKSYSPRLQVRFDKYRVKKQGQRIFKDVDLWNVVAVLPGTKHARNAGARSPATTTRSTSERAGPPPSPASPPSS